MAFTIRTPSGNTDSGSSIVVTKPAGTVDGDVLIAAVVFPAVQATIGAVTDPAGWDRQDWLDSTTHSVMWLSKEASSEGASYTWSWTGTRKVSAAIIAFDGTGTYPPFEGWTTNTGTASTAHMAVGPTPTESDDLLVTIHSGDNPGAGITSSYTPHAGMTEQADYPAALGGFGDAPYLSICTLQLSASGFTGSKTAVSTETQEFACFGIMVISDNPSSDATVYPTNPVGVVARIADFQGTFDGGFTTETVRAEAYVDGALITDGGVPLADPLDGFAVEFSGGVSPRSATRIWRDITEDVMAIDISRGRNERLSQFSAGTARIRLKNLDRKYDPLNGDGPWFLMLKPTAPIRIRCRDAAGVYRTLFDGYVRLENGWNPVYPTTTVSYCDVSCTDLLAGIARVELATLEILDPEVVDIGDPDLFTQYGDGDLPSERIAKVLDQAGVISNYRDMPATGVTYLGPTLYGGNALQYIQTVTATEGGALYCSADGKITFKTRHAVITAGDSGTVMFAFGQGEDAPFLDDGSLEVDHASTIYNEARVIAAANVLGEGTAPVEQVVEDSTAVGNFGRSTYSVSGLFMRDDPEAYAHAEQVVAQYANPFTSPKTIAIAPRVGGNTLDAATQLELTDRVSVTFAPPGGGDEIAQDVFIERISHQVVFRDRSWKTTFGFSPADLFGYALSDQWIELDEASAELNSGRLAF